MMLLLLHKLLQFVVVCGRKHTCVHSLDITVSLCCIIMFQHWSDWCHTRQDIYVQSYQGLCKSHDVWCTGARHHTSRLDYSQAYQGLCKTHEPGAQTGHWGVGVIAAAGRTIPGLTGGCCCCHRHGDVGSWLLGLLLAKSGAPLLRQMLLLLCRCSSSWSGARY